MAAAVGIPPIGHEYSRTFLIHIMSPLGGGGWSPPPRLGIISPLGEDWQMRAAKRRK
jgi:hypothetical protein